MKSSLFDSGLKIDSFSLVILYLQDYGEGGIAKLAPELAQLNNGGKV